MLATSWGLRRGSTMLKTRKCKVPELAASVDALTIHEGNCLIKIWSSTPVAAEGANGTGNIARVFGTMHCGA